MEIRLSEEAGVDVTGEVTMTSQEFLDHVVKTGQVMFYNRSVPVIGVAKDFVRAMHTLSAKIASATRDNPEVGIEDVGEILGDFHREVMHCLRPEISKAVREEVEGGSKSKDFTAHLARSIVRAKKVQEDSLYFPVGELENSLERDENIDFFITDKWKSEGTEDWVRVVG